MSSSIKVQPYLDFSLELIKESRALLCKAFEKRSRDKKEKEKIEMKSDGSPVTALDKEVELLFREKIEKKFPGHAIWGEEFGQTSKEKQKDTDFLWILDPIDGTRSFIEGSPFFGTLIALLYKTRPLLGLIDMPILKEAYWGLEGKGSFKQDARGLHKIRTRPCSGFRKAVLRTTDLEYFSQEKAKATIMGRRDREVFESLQGLCSETLYGGDCYCYAFLASGLADLVLEVGLAPYDFFALIPLVEGAGGKISDWQGKPLSLEAGKGDILACGDPSLHQLALRHIKNMQKL